MLGESGEMDSMARLEQKAIGSCILDNVSQYTLEPFRLQVYAYTLKCTVFVMFWWTIRCNSVTRLI
jgi:hypothetical protein